MIDGGRERGGSEVYKTVGDLSDWYLGNIDGSIEQRKMCINYGCHIGTRTRWELSHLV